MQNSDLKNACSTGWFVSWRLSIVQNCDLKSACPTGWFSCCLDVVDRAEL